jgi:hypothetical protein
MQGLIDDKSRLETQYQKLNTAYEQNLNEQNDLLALCSTYEDQLTTCRNIIQSAGLTVLKFYLKKSFFNHRLFRYQISYLSSITTNDSLIQCDILFSLFISHFKSLYYCFCVYMHLLIFFYCFSCELIVKNRTIWDMELLY